MNSARDRRKGFFFFLHDIKAATGYDTCSWLTGAKPASCWSRFPSCLGLLGERLSLTHHFLAAMFNGHVAGAESAQVRERKGAASHQCNYR